MIGVNSAIASQTGFYQGYGFAIPINLARTVGRQLIAEGKVTRAVLGIQIKDATPEDAAYVGLDSVRGVTVQDYTPEIDSPAKRAGILPGDVIVALDGKPVHYSAELQQAVGFKRPGEEVAVTVRRRIGNAAPEEKTFRVRLAPQPGNTQLASRAGDSASGRGTAPYEKLLGVSVEPLTEREAAQNEQIGAERAGLVVVDVDPDGPAADKLFPRRSGQGTDIITHVNGARVKTVADLSAALKSVRPGEIVSLRTYLVAPTGDQGVSRVIRLRVGAGN